jgi:hypothetical protein
MSLAAPSEALGQLGKGIQQAGGVLEVLGQKQRQAETDVQVAEADNSMLAEKSSFEQWKTEHPDPSDWSTEWEKAALDAEAERSQQFETAHGRRGANRVAAHSLQRAING